MILNSTNSLTWNHFSIFWCLPLLSLVGCSFHCRDFLTFILKYLHFYTAMGLIFLSHGIVSLYKDYWFFCELILYSATLPKSPAHSNSLFILRVFWFPYIQNQTIFYVTIKSKRVLLPFGGCILSALAILPSNTGSTSAGAIRSDIFELSIAYTL